MSRTRRIRTEPQAPPALSHADLMLAVHGPWDERAGCTGQPGVLWDPRVRPEHLKQLWAQHAPAIQQAAAAAGVKPWVVDRLFFVAAARGEA